MQQIDVKKPTNQATLTDLVRELSDYNGISIWTIHFRNLNPSHQIEHGQHGGDKDHLDKCYPTWRIEYAIEELPHPTRFDSYPLFPEAEDIPAAQEKIVHEIFPFSRSSEKKNFVTPNWVKSLLFKMNTMQKVPEIIKFFNKGGEAQMEVDHPHDHKLSFLQIEDILLRPFSKYEME